jgi:hypothetical protein
MTSGTAGHSHVRARFGAAHDGWTALHRLRPLRHLVRPALRPRPPLLLRRLPHRRLPRRKRRQQQEDRQRQRRQQGTSSGERARPAARARPGTAAAAARRHQPARYLVWPLRWCACPHTSLTTTRPTSARRRYEGLRVKAASTSFPHEADACRAKAEAMRDKYGL